jgi:hypothetical protein
MQKLKVNLENCYGITKLQYEFDFSEKKAISLYAPNGTMKTSFAKTFKDYCNNKESKDQVNLELQPIREIQDETGSEIESNQIFVIEPYIEDYKCDKISTLLVNQELKDKYDEILRKIDSEKNNLLSKLKQLSGLTGRTITVESELIKIFGNKSIFEILLGLEPLINERNDHNFSSIIYSKIFEEKVEKFLNTKDFKRQIKAYIERFITLMESSKYLKKGFNHSSATEIQKILKSSRFFKAEHSLNLFNGSTNDIIKNEDDLQAIINKELETVLSDPDIQKRFNEIDGKLTTIQLKEFRGYLFDNKFILTELENLENFKKEIWYSYLVEQKVLFNNLLDEYKVGKAEIESIIGQANTQKTQWIEVIDIFNKRFSVPFKLKLTNQDDVILKREVPNLEFIFHDKYQINEPKSIGETELLGILSQGERRALYLLNIIFEVRARQKSSQKTIFIIDDIADSFDYKNKYAIIEYLKDILDEPIFFQVILTHNFDFHRTVSGRLYIPRNNKLNTLKTVNGITIIKEKYQKNPFLTWKKNLCKDNAMLIASIPFIRNLAEYSGNLKECKKLTSLLHLKDDTGLLYVSDLETMFKTILVDKPSLVLPNPEKLVIHLIDETCNLIASETSDDIELEKKIVLSIGIRLKAEGYMIKEINDEVFWKTIDGNQTIELINRYKITFPTKEREIAILEEVNLMTPENIHLNSFMYEPILDMSNEHLKRLYNDVKTILQ